VLLLLSSFTFNPQGFSGMEHILKSAVKEGENPIAVVDGAKAGLQLLAGIVANNYRG